ncbi:MAG: YidC/Oxa1 family membrane protein insertase [Firmicutes bacterium]|nr:YidC/Oxa1 family membrane protein insertase [Bacillota bacterium]
MILAFSISDIIRVPFGYLMDYLYRFTNNYGLALILFAVLVQLVMLPITAKSKKSTMKMSRLSPRIQEIQKKYANDQQKQNEAIQQLQKEEGATMGMGGCLWSLVPLLILLPLYQVVRQPLVYMLHESAETAEQIVALIKEADASLFTNNTYYDQMVAARHIASYADAIKEAIPEVADRTLQGLNFTFLGVDLGSQPVFNIFGSSWSWDWAHIGGFLLPVISAGFQVVQSLVNQKMNNSVITDEKGLEDKETAKNSQQNQSMKMMIWMMPLMSLWIGFSVPAALSLYWFIGGVVRTVEDTILTARYRKIYDAEDAERLKRALEQEAIEAEKERQRAERRAANPDGITENTSKKKLQKQQQRDEEAARAAARKEYAARKGAAVQEEETAETPSGIPERPYCKGRNYDPNRYRAETTEE